MLQKNVTKLNPAHLHWSPNHSGHDENPQFCYLSCSLFSPLEDHDWSLCHLSGEWESFHCQWESLHFHTQYWAGLCSYHFLYQFYLQSGWTAYYHSLEKPGSHLPCRYPPYKIQAQTSADGRSSHCLVRLPGGCSPFPPPRPALRARELLESCWCWGWRAGTAAAAAGTAPAAGESPSAAAGELEWYSACPLPPHQAGWWSHSVLYKENTFVANT